jgi:hypothetical protein
MRCSKGKGKGNGSVNQSLVMTSKCDVCVCVCSVHVCEEGSVLRWNKGTERAGRSSGCPLSRPSVVPSGQQWTIVFLICCQLFPLLALLACLGPWSGCVWVPRLSEGGRAAGRQAGKRRQCGRQCPAGQRDDPFRKLQSMRLDQGLPGRCDQACEWLSCWPVRPANTWPAVPGLLGT